MAIPCGSELAREEAGTFTELLRWIFPMYLPQQRILVLPQLVGPALELQAVFPILIVILADELLRDQASDCLLAFFVAFRVSSFVGW
jgi:hypothetical protein